MICLKCGKQLPEEAQFCIQCGSKIIISSTAKGRNFEGAVAEWLKTQGYNEIEPNIRVAVRPGFKFECDIHAQSCPPLWAVLLGKKQTGHHAWVECKSYKVIRDHVLKLAANTDDLAKYKMADWKPRYVMLFSAVGFDSGALSYALEKGIGCYQQTENGFVLVQGGAARSGSAGVSDKALFVAAVVAAIVLIFAVVSLTPRHPTLPATQVVEVPSIVEAKTVRDSKMSYPQAQASSPASTTKPEPDPTHIPPTPAAALAADTTPYPLSANLKPTITYKEKPIYTEEAKIQKVQGTVVLQVVFGADGTITDIQTIRGLPYGLTESAIDVAQKITFLPARKDGVAVSVRGQLEFSFNYD